MLTQIRAMSRWSVIWLVTLTSLQAQADSVSSRIQVDNEFGRNPASVRVTWIEWDSGFRDSDLKIGDRVVGFVSPRQVRMTLTEEMMRNGWAPGGYGEETYWDSERTHEGDPLTLLVLRSGKEVAIQAPLRAEKFYYTPSGRQALGDNGPDRMAYDGFSDHVWIFWYDEFVKKASYILDDAWNRYHSFNNRIELEEWLEVHAPRVEYLKAHHPGNFSKRASQDYESVKASLLGTLYVITPESQVWRDAQKKSVVIAKREGLAAIEHLKAEQPENWTDPFPLPNPIMEDIKPWVGKWVELPGLTERNFITDLGKSYIVAGSEYNGYYLVPAKTPKMDVFFDTLFQFQSLYSNEIRWEFFFFAKVTDETRMVSYRDQTITTLMVEPFAAYVGSREDDLKSKNPESGFFTDLRVEPSVPVLGTDRKRFPVAGEDQMHLDISPPVPDSATPSQVVEAMIEALKYKNMNYWATLFAPWTFYYEKPYPPVFIPNREISSSSLRSAWDHSQALLTNRQDTSPDVIDVRVVQEGWPVIVFPEDPVAQIPQIEQVYVYIDHIGLFGTEYRSFTNFQVNRVWRLQRLGRGPWRIIEVQSL